MKSRFDVIEDVFGNYSIKEIPKYYDENYKPYGFVLDLKNQICYKDYDLPIALSMREIVIINLKEQKKYKICFKKHDIENDIIHYSLVLLNENDEYENYN